MQGYGLVVRFTLQPGHEAAFDALVSETVAQIRVDEPGTLVYVSHRLEAEPLVRVFYELYRDREAFEEHERRPHTVRFLSERERHLAGLHVDFLDALDGKGPGAASR